MRPKLSRADVDACSSALAELHAWNSVNDFPEQALTLLSSLVAADRISYEAFHDPEIFRPAHGNGADGGAGSPPARPEGPHPPGPTALRPVSAPVRHQILSHPAIADIQTLLPRFIASLRTHPLFSHYQAAGTLPRKISDVATLRQFMGTAVYREFYRRIGARREMLLFLQVEGETRIGFSFHREGADFSERDRAVLAWLSPYLSQARQRARRASEAAAVLESLERGFSAMGRAVIVAERGGRVRWMTPLARTWIEEFLRSPVDSPEWLPQSLRLEMRRLEAVAPGAGGAPGPATLRMAGRAGRQFAARVGVAGEGNLVVVLTQAREGFDASIAEHFGLTRRQGQALQWVSEGKSNKEISGILEVSPRTIQQHLHVVFDKIGVENRWAAQRVVAEFREQG